MFLLAYLLLKKLPSAPCIYEEIRHVLVHSVGDLRDFRVIIGSVMRILIRN